MIEVEDIVRAQKRIASYIIETPVEKSNILPEGGTEVLLKLENFQVSGSFKPRGGFNKILKTWEKDPNAEFVAPTAGGHGVGLSYAAKMLNANAHIYMPEHADKDRLKDVKNNGATIKLFNSVPEARKAAKEAVNEKNYTFVSAYNDIEMIEGAGTIGLELLKQVPDMDCLVCGVGGGGYLAGIGLVLKAFNPSIQIFGVQQENAPFLATWFKTGVYPSDLQITPSIAEGVGAEVEEDSITWPYVKEFTEDFLIVSEEQIESTMLWTLSNHKHYVEPSGVVGLSAIQHYPDIFKKFKKVVTVISGRNMSFDKFTSILNR